MKPFRAIVSATLHKTMLAGLLAVTPAVVTLVATSAFPTQTLIRFDVAEAQVKAKNKTFEPRRLPGVSQSFAKGLTEAGNLIQPPEAEDGTQAKPNPRKAIEVLDNLSKGKDKFNPYEMAQLYQFYAYSYYQLEDNKKAREYFERVLGQAPNIPISLEASTTLTISQLYGNEENRSEEHTSELQSRPHLVCRLLLEKKNKKNKQ